jgi:glycosyltransferase involved in cell wall biosynthesis
MISVVIPTHESERALVHTLAALVPGALAGVVREVIVTDAGSRDDTAAVADVAGCRFMLQPGGTLGARLSAAAATARADWFWFLQPGGVPEPGWFEEIESFVRANERGGKLPLHAAVLRWRPGGSRSTFTQSLARVQAAFGTPKPQQGLLIAKVLYRSLGGHDAILPEPERAFLRKLGRQRIAVLSCAMTWRGQS